MVREDKRFFKAVIVFALMVFSLILSAGAVLAEDIYVSLPEEDFALTEGMQVPTNVPDFEVDVDTVSVTDINWYFRNGKQYELMEPGSCFHKGSWHVELTFDDPYDFLPEDDTNTIRVNGQFGYETWKHVMTDGTEKTYASPNFNIMETRFQMGEGVYCVFDYKTSTLTFFGDGAMYNYNDEEESDIQSLPYPILLNSGMIKHAVFEDGITRIGDCVLEGCHSLEDITLGDSIKYIGNFSFVDCDHLEKVTLNEGLLNIGEKAFAYCEQLSEIEFPSTLQGIWAGAFDHCISLTGADIPDTVVMVLEEAFANCSDLQKVILPLHLFEDGVYSESEVFLNSGNAVPVYRIGKDVISPIPKQSYTGKPVEPKITVSCGNVTLKEGRDFTVTYKKNTNAGTASATVTGTGDYTGSFKVTFKIKKSRISLQKAEIEEIGDVVYSGKKKKPDVVVTLDGTELISGKDYKVTYSNNVAIGKAKVTVKGKGSYKGTITSSFKILPKKITLKTPAAGKKKVRLKWKKRSGQINGYQIEYSTDKTFETGVKRKWVKKPGAVSATIKKLKRKTTYYVRIRAYRKISKKYYYSSWSKRKKFTTK